MNEQPVKRLALTVPEAAESLGVSVSFFRLTVMPELGAVRRGRRILVPVAELDRWLRENGARLVDR